MSKVMALDIETGNYSYEIGGWDKHALFEPTVVATWDGTNGDVFSKQEVDMVSANVHDLHPRTLGDHLQKHIDDGGIILGHNIKKFDLPVLNAALDCWTAGDLMSKAESVIDTKSLISKVGGNNIATSLEILARNTLSIGKSMTSHDAPEAWRAGRYLEVAEYCLKDAQLTYDLYQYGKENGVIKSRSLDDGSIVEIEVNWE
jgi:DEAD/DEAH box helicase domain-containing protein